jgi:translation initiation factor 2 gamma subunit (eIF-2gamma)
MIYRRVCMTLCTALLSVATAAEALAAVAPGSPVRVMTTRGTGITVDRFEGRLVNGEDPLVLITATGDTLQVGYDEIAKVEIGVTAKAKRSKTGTLVGALLIGGMTTLYLFVQALSDDSAISDTRHPVAVIAGIGAAGVLAGGYVGGVRRGTTIEWREIRKSELRASE